jgi:hypothetical protein
MDYSVILKRAWKIIWKYKILWIFGILGSCTARQSGGSFSGNNFNYRGNNNNFNSPSLHNMQLPPAVREWLLQIDRLADNGQLWVYMVIFFIALLLLIIVLRLIFLAVGTVGEIGLINGVWDVEEGAEKLAFRALLSKGWKSFWKVILFKIVLAVAWFIVGIVVLILTIATLCCGAIVLIPAMMVLQFAVWVLTELVMVTMVAEEKPVFEAIETTWALFKKNWMNSGIMGIILAVINIVVSIVIAIPGILAALPVIFGVIASSSSHSYEGLLTSILITVGLLLLYMPFSIFFYGVLVSYLNSAWVLTYRNLTGRQAVVTPPLVIDVPPAPEEPAVVG